MTHPGTQTRSRPATTRIVSVLVAGALTIAGCSGGGGSDETLAPIASTLAPNEPVVVVGDGSNTADDDIALSEGSAGDAQGDENETPSAATVPLDIDVIDDLLATTAPPQTDPAQTDPAQTDPAQTTAPQSSAPAEPAAPANATTTTVEPTVTATQGSGTRAPDSTQAPAETTSPTSATTQPENPDPGNEPPDDAIVLTELSASTDTAPDAGTIPLEIVKYAPDGAVATAPFIAVTFNQPMVSLSDVRNLTGQQPPISIAPTPAGRWRWVGARTARFEVFLDEQNPIRRLPAATDYAVTVSADIESATGSRLGSDASWSFSTPPPTVRSVANAVEAGDDRDDSDPQVAVNPVFVARFDQTVDPTEIMQVVSLTAGDTEIPLRLATETEIEADENAGNAVDADPTRTVAVTPTAELPTDTALSLTIGPNIPSAEGPKLNPDAVTFVAHTHGPLTVTDARCVEPRCDAGTGLKLEFNNEIDTSQVTNADLVDMLTVEPTIPGLSINIVGSTVVFDGVTAANTTYTLRADARLTDVFGQSLGTPQSRTVDVGDALPRFRGPTSPMVVVDPESDSPKLAVETVNYDKLLVSVWAVSMRDYADYLALGETVGDSDEIEAPEAWQRFDEREIEIGGSENETVTTEIDLDDEFAQAGSQLVVYVRPQFAQGSDSAYATDPPLLAWVQQTSLAIDAIADEANLLIWTTDLRTGKPIGDVPVDLIGDGRVATTDDEGIALVKLDDVPLSGLFANDGSRIVFLPAPGGRGWNKSDGDTGGRWSVVTDRGVYRPGDTLRLTGWLRGLTPDAAELLSTPPEGSEIAVSAKDALGTNLGVQSTTTNRLGGFSVELELPKNPSRGEAQITLAQGDDETTVSFRIEDYRAPEFEVTLEPRDGGPFVASKPVELIASGAYYSGGPVANADTAWTVTSHTTSYRPPNQAEYAFGRDVSKYTVDDCVDCDVNESVKQFDGTTDGSGSHYLKVAADASTGLPTAISAVATITDINRQNWAGSTRFVIHPAATYVGLKTDELFVESGETMGVDAVVTGIDGVPLEGRDVSVSVSAVRASYVNGEWNEALEKVDGCAFTSTDPDVSATDSMRCEFKLSEPGQYRIVAEVTDAGGNTSRTEIDRFVAGSLARASSQLTADTAQIVPDKASYEPGDTARLLISSPWAPARGVVAISRFGIAETIPFDAEDGTAVVEVPITERSVPNAIGWVTMAGTAPRLDRFGNPIPGATRPAVASAQINLPVPATSRTLSVSAGSGTPTIEPGKDTSVHVRVDDLDGAPVSGAQVAVIVVDDAMLALTDYKIENPADEFYAPYFGALSGRSVREYVQLLRSDEVDIGASDAPSTTAPQSGDAAVDPIPSNTTATDATSTDATLSDAGGSAGTAATNRPGDTRNLAAVRTRANLAPVAVFSPDNITDESGSVTVDFRAPDNLTSYRIIALAVADNQRFGFGESSVEAGQPLEVRPSAPSFVRLGDTFGLPVVVRNQTDTSRTIQIAADPTGLEPTGPVGQQVTIPARSKVELRFDLVANKTGQAKVRFVARGAGEATLTDSVVTTVDVYPPSTTETVAAYGTLDALDNQVAAIQPVRPPKRSSSGYGGVDVQVNPTILSNLVDAIEFLRDDAYTSTSANASRVVGIASLEGVLDSLSATGVGDPTLLTARGRRSMNDLISSQRDDGGWTAWPRQERSDPWSSVLAAHALTVAVDAGWLTEDSPVFDDAVTYLTDIDSHIPTYVDGAVRWTLEAYAIKVLNEFGETTQPTASLKASELFKRHGDELEADALAMIWPSIIDEATRDEIERRLTNSAVNTADGVRFATDYGEYGFVIADSDQRTDAVVLDAFLAMRPSADLVPKAMRALLGDRSQGRWSNDQANAMATLAVRHYYDRFESDSVQIDARAWIGNRSILEHTFDGTERNVAAANIPIPQVRSDSTDGIARVTVSNTGSGRLYFRVGMTYAIDGATAPADEGFVVERIYEPIAKNDDVVRNRDGSWTIKAGAPVRVRLTMVADDQRTNVALTDPFPAGLEPVNPSLAVSQTLHDPAKTTWRGHGWFDHQSLTPTRAEAIATLLPGGLYEYTYVARAITPGEFGVPPARAEELYDPEVFGRSASDRVTIVTTD